LKFIEILAAICKEDPSDKALLSKVQSFLTKFWVEGIFRDSDSKPAFFISDKIAADIDTTLLNYHLL
jgi:hypothetical protein